MGRVALAGICMPRMVASWRRSGRSIRLSGPVGMITGWVAGGVGAWLAGAGVRGARVGRFGAGGSGGAFLP